MVKVDVLIPHYNDSEGLQLSLQSINEQTWKGDFRIVICDDGSEPECLEEVKTIAQQDTRIELLENEVNLGRPKTRNRLMDVIESEYVAWLDAGDEWYPEKIQEQFYAIYRAQYRYEEKNVWVTCNYDWQWVGKRKRKRIQNTDGEQLKKIMVGSDLRSYLWTILGTAESFKSVGPFDENLPRLQDLDYFMRFVAKGGVLVSPLTSRSLCVYHKSDIGRNAREIRHCYYYIYNKQLHLYSRYSKKFRKNRRYNIELHAARFAESNKDSFLKVNYVVKAVFVNPIGFLYRLYKNRGLKL